MDSKETANILKLDQKKRVNLSKIDKFFKVHVCTVQVKAEVQSFWSQTCGLQGLHLSLVSIVLGRGESVIPPGQNTSPLQVTGT